MKTNIACYWWVNVLEIAQEELITPQPLGGFSPCPPYMLNFTTVYGRIILANSVCVNDLSSMKMTTRKLYFMKYQKHSFYYDRANEFFSN